MEPRRHNPAHAIPIEPPSQSGRVAWRYGQSCNQPETALPYDAFVDHLHRSQHTLTAYDHLEMLHPHRPASGGDAPLWNWGVPSWHSRYGLERTLVALKAAAPLALLTAIEMAPLRTSDELTNHSWRLLANAADRFLGRPSVRANSRAGLPPKHQIFYSAWWNRVLCRFAFVDALSVNYGEFPETRAGSCDFDWWWLHHWSRQNSTTPAQRTAALNIACVHLARSNWRPEELQGLSPAAVGDPT